MNNKEMVDHPSHYKVGKYEVIDVIEGQNWGKGFNRGSAVKYILRAGIKDPDKEIEDLGKARWYLDREIARLRSEKEGEYATLVRSRLARPTISAVELLAQYDRAKNDEIWPGFIDNKEEVNKQC